MREGERDSYGSVGEWAGEGSYVVVTMINPNFD